MQRNLPSLSETNTPMSAAITSSRVLWSSGNKWKNLIVEKHRFSESSTIKLNNANHNVIIKLPTFENPEIPSDYTPGNNDGNCGKVCMLSAATSGPVCSHHRDSIVLFVSENAFASKPTIAEIHQFKDEQIEHIAMALKSEVESGYVSGRVYGESICTALSAHLTNQYSTVRVQDRIQNAKLTPGNLQKITKYIDANLHEDLRLSDLAEIVGLNQYRFAHNFKDTTGYAPHQFIVRLRLERAKKMLRETEMSVTEIAYAVGYGSPSRFTQSFRRHNGITPSAYRSS
ncbi:MAG: helix-turn-helix domain-containing protein [Pyrinomonadaceae bacterium]